MEALAASLIALATALFTATRLKRDFDRDYVVDLESDNKRLEKERDEWKRRAETAESQYARMLRDWYREKGVTPP